MVVSILYVIISIMCTYKPRLFTSFARALIIFGVLLAAGCDKDPETESTELATKTTLAREDLNAFTEKFADPELEAFKGDLDAMKERGLIRALVTPSPTEFFIDDGKIRGIQAEYLQQFAKFINRGIKNEADKIRIKYVPVPFPELIPALLEGRGDIIATFLTVTDKRAELVSFTEPFRSSVNEIIVTNKDEPELTAVEDIAGKDVYVLANSSYVEHLLKLNTRLKQQGLDPVNIKQADPRLLSEDILEFVNAGVMQRAVVDNYIAELWQKVLTNIVVDESLAITADTQVAWAVRQDAKKLQGMLNQFITKVREGAKIGNILFDRYYENTRWIKNPTAKSERDKLNRYLDLFNKYGEIYGFDPLALAAQAYQESGLTHNKRSHAGAVGVMQVLPTTASDPKVNIKNIKDPEANIHAGTKYLAFLRDHYFSDPEIDEWNQQAFAWASYNAGPRKIRRARSVAKKMGLDPNIWFGNVEVAAARTISREPVRYVANIYRYFVAYRLLNIQEEQRLEATNKL